MEGQATIATEVLASYAADVALEVEGVRALVDRPGPGRRGVKVSGGDDAVRVELQLALEWGASMPAVGREVQTRVREYLARMADVHDAHVDVLVADVGPRP